MGIRFLAALDLEAALRAIEGDQIMEKVGDAHLTEFNPLSHLALPGKKRITPKGLILVVGPNSSGKTQLLKDIQLSILGQPRTLVVASEIGIRKPRSFDAMLDALEREGYIRRTTKENGEISIKVRTTGLGGSVSIPQQEVDYIVAKRWFDEYQEGQRNLSPQPFLIFFGAMLSTFLFLPSRLSEVNGQTSNYDYLNLHPSNDLQALYYSSSAKQDLARDVREVFGRGIWVDPTRANQLHVRVTDSRDLPPAEDRLSPDKVIVAGRFLGEEGDGLKSFVAIDMCLALSRRPVCLVDEPEMCLHPPQAFALGRVIARQATKHPVTTLVATHSSHVLRGVVQETKEVQIIRLTRAAGRFAAHRVDSKLLAKAIEKPLVRSETIFDGIFADGVVLVESEGDRAVYQAVWETTSTAQHLDLLFVPLNGKGPMADVARFFLALRIPVAVIADLDLVKDDGVIPKLLKPMSASHRVATAIQKECRKTAVALKRVEPTIGPSQVRGKIARMQKLPMVWQNNDDEVIMRQLKELLDRVNRMRKLKEGGIRAYELEHPRIAERLEILKNRFWKWGVFVVPVGELESWFSDDFMARGPSRRKRKQEFAEEAANRIRREHGKAGDIIKFIESVANFIREKQANALKKRHTPSRG